MHDTLSNDAKVLCAQMLVATTAMKSVPTNYFEEILRLPKSKFDAALKELVAAGYLVDTQEIEGGRSDWQVSCTPRAQSSITNINTTSVIDSFPDKESLHGNPPIIRGIPNSNSDESHFLLEPPIVEVKTKPSNQKASSTKMRKTATSVPVAMREAPAREICKAWHKHFPNKIQWTGCRGTRKAHLNTRWVELFASGEYATAEEGLAWWDQTFAWCAKSKVLREMKFFELEWLIYPGNFDKTMEGRYHD